MFFIADWKLASNTATSTSVVITGRVSTPAIAWSSAAAISLLMAASRDTPVITTHQRALDQKIRDVYN